MRATIGRRLVAIVVAAALAACVSSTGPAWILGIASAAGTGTPHDARSLPARRGDPNRGVRLQAFDLGRAGPAGTAASALPRLTVDVASSSTISSGGALDWHGRASVKRRADGVVVLAYRRATAHPVNDGALYIRFSDDDGATWTAEDTTLGGRAVVGFPMDPSTLSPGQDAGEPWLYLAPNGDLVLHMWRVAYGRALGGTYQSRSTDGGETWSPATGPVRFAGLTADESGRTFATDDDFVFGGVIYAGARTYDDVSGSPSALSLIASDDDGATWRRRSTIVGAREADGKGGQEVGLAYVGDDTIIAMIRDNSHTHSYERVSTDLGRTWGPLIDVTSTVGIAGRQRIQTGAQLRGEASWWNDDVLIMNGFVHQVSGSSRSRRNCVWISRDRGATWSPPSYVDETTEDAGYGDMFYDPTNERYVYVSYQGTQATARLVQYDLEIGGI